ncbi:MAG: barstar family protein [Planctomycetes bacterium]|nr:barstar family protein [Planctomycetota bacterium]
MSQPTLPKFGGYDHAVVVPPGIGDKQDLLTVLAKRLQLPEHFGHNWDALADCLSDLSWLPEGNIYLIHEDLPLAGDRDAAATYVDVLLDAQEDWQREGKARLTPVFPRRYRELVLALGRRASRE